MKPTDSELEILRLLWKKGPSTVRVINDAVSEKRDVGYTTTLKIMQIMHEKGLLQREKEGKTHIYSPAITEENTQRELSRNLLDAAFGGSAKRLVMSVLGSSKADASELKEIRAYLDKLDKTQNDG